MHYINGHHLLLTMFKKTILHAMVNNNMLFVLHLFKQLTDAFISIKINIKFFARVGRELFHDF